MPETIVENEACKIFWDSVIQTDHQTSTRKPALVIMGAGMVDFAIPADHGENQRK